MKIEKLRNKKSYKWFLCGLILVVVLTITLIKGSRAGYKSTASIALTSGVVKYSSYDFNLISMYIDGVEQEKSIILPSTIANYTLNEEETYCYKESKSNKDNNAKISINVLGGLEIKGISKGSKCILSLNTKTETSKTMADLLNSHYTINTNRSADNKDFNVPFTKTTYGVLYSAPDDDGTSYYFAGNPLDNWVEFGGYYWRIIRVNGDGSIRMIYQGTEPNVTGLGTQINGSTYAFNNSYNDNKYVGYLYNENGVDKPSNAYTELNNWFANSNIKQGTSYFNLIDPDAAFCGDRTPSISNTTIDGSGGTGTTTTYYGAYIRLRPGGSNPTASSKAVNPTFNCADNADLYTYTGANQGNKKLANPVGMITADEVAYAGMVYEVVSSGSYLDTQQAYWTISPYHFDGSNYAYVFYVRSSGYIYGYYYVGIKLGIRPVINIRSDVQFTGNGTQSNPYKVVIS